MDSSTKTLQQYGPHQMDRASSVASSNTTGSSEPSTDHPWPGSDRMQSPVALNEKNENANIVTDGHRLSQVTAANTFSMLTERAVADVQHAASVDVHAKSGSNGKRKGRQGQKSKEAYNRKRRDKKKQDRRERAATARQLTAVHEAQ